MILADTSVWIDHLRAGASAGPLVRLLEEGEVAAHPWVVAELALGNVGRRRSVVLADLERLPALAVLADREVRELVEARRLHGRGLGWVDAHLLASCLVSGAELWTLDGPLARAARVCAVAAAW